MRLLPTFGAAYNVHRHCCGAKLSQKRGNAHNCLRALQAQYGPSFNLMVALGVSTFVCGIVTSWYFGSSWTGCFSPFPKEPAAEYGGRASAYVLPGPS